jgi:hypothetical protein
VSEPSDKPAEAGSRRAIGPRQHPQPPAIAELAPHEETQRAVRGAPTMEDDLPEDIRARLRESTRAIEAWVGPVAAALAEPTEALHRRLAADEAASGETSNMHEGPPAPAQLAADPESRAPRDRARDRVDAASEPALAETDDDPAGLPAALAEPAAAHVTGEEGIAAAEPKPAEPRGFVEAGEIVGDVATGLPESAATSSMCTTASESAKVDLSPSAESAAEAPPERDEVLGEEPMRDDNAEATVTFVTREPRAPLLPSLDQPVDFGTERKSALFNRLREVNPPAGDGHSATKFEPAAGAPEADVTILTQEAVQATQKSEERTNRVQRFLKALSGD